MLRKIIIAGLTGECIFPATTRYCSNGYLIYCTDALEFIVGLTGVCKLRNPQKWSLWTTAPMLVFRHRRFNRRQTLCNTWFIKGHKPSNHIRTRIKSHVYTTEWTVYHITYHVKRHNKANTNVIYYINDNNVWYSGSEVQIRIKLSEAEAGRHRDVDWETNT